MEHLENMSPEQRRQIYTGALEYLGVVMETLRYTRWNPFADNSSAETHDYDPRQSYSGFEIVDTHSGSQVMATYEFYTGRLWEEHGKTITNIMVGESKEEIGPLNCQFKIVSVREDKRRVNNLFDIRVDDGRRIQCVAFDAKTALFVPFSDSSKYHIDSSETAASWKQGDFDVILGTERKPGGNIDLIIEFMHPTGHLNVLLDRPHRLSIADYMAGDIPTGLFSLKGTQEMIAWMAETVPEIFPVEFASRYTNPIEGTSEDLPLPQFGSLASEAHNTLVVDRLDESETGDRNDTLPIVKAHELQGKFGVSAEELTERIATVIDRPTRQGLIRAGMWDVSVPTPAFINIATEKGAQILTHSVGTLNLNTALIFSPDGVMGVLTDVDRVNVGETRTMVVDYRTIIEDNRKRLIVTCLKKDERGPKIPSLADGGYVFEFIFDDPNDQLSPDILLEALQALDLEDNRSGLGYSINRYKFE